MKKLLPFALLFFSYSFFAQSFIQAYADCVNQLTQTNVTTDLQEFVSYGVKTTGSTNNNNALAWLKSKYTSMGYTTTQLAEDPFTYNGNPTKNLIITKTGTLYPNTFVIICAHYDTITGVGANDNGSGTTILLEAARILRNIPTDYSIKFIHFSGEEQGLYGSSNYVNNVVNSTSPKLSIKLVFNIDQVGGRAGQVNNTITCERDTNNTPSTNNTASNTITQELMNCVSLYSPLQTNLSYAYSSDYVPFQSNNEVITGFYEYNVSPYPHTVNDTMANMDPVYVYNVGKAAIGALQHFAGATTLGTAEANISGINIYPNPTKDFIHIDFDKSNNKDFEAILTDSAGKLIFKTKNKEKIDVSYLENGVYLLTVKSEHKTITKKLMIAK